MSEVPVQQSTTARSASPAGGDSAAERRLDGNAAAGVLREVFAVDVVAGRSTCAHCGRTAALAEHALWADAPAMVLRCPSCSGVVMRVGAAGGRVRLDLGGAAVLVLELPEQP